MLGGQDTQAFQVLDLGMLGGFERESPVDYARIIEEPLYQPLQRLDVAVHHRDDERSQQWHIIEFVAILLCEHRPCAHALDYLAARLPCHRERRLEPA